jgi:hypothetical protein
MGDAYTSDLTRLNFDLTKIKAYANRYDIDDSKMTSTCELPQAENISYEKLDMSKHKYRSKQDQPVILMQNLPPSSSRRVLDQNPHTSTASRSGSKKRDRSGEILKRAANRRMKGKKNLHQLNSVTDTSPEPPKPIKNKTTPNLPNVDKLRDIAKNPAQLKKLLSDEKEAVSYILDLNSIIQQLMVALNQWSSFAENMPREMNNFSMGMTLKAFDPQLSTQEGPVQKLQHSIYEHFISPGRGTPTNNTDLKKFEVYSDFIEKTINIFCHHGLLDQKGWEQTKMPLFGLDNLFEVISNLVFAHNSAGKQPETKSEQSAMIKDLKLECSRLTDERDEVFEDMEMSKKTSKGIFKE